MKSCSRKNNSAAREVRRARPLLGTLVEIRVHGLRPDEAQAAIDRAFAAVSRVHALMSPHDPASDVARINRHRGPRVVRVHAWTYRVLAAARLLSALSGGAFDVSAASRRAGARPGAGGDWRNLELLSGYRVAVGRRLPIDLGGIAKGFAVDRAVEILREAGAPAGVVNAGGDLFAFGFKPERVHVRHPAAPSVLVPMADLTDEALATSANYFDLPEAGRLLRPDGRRLWLGRGSVSVRAPSCMWADALCKVVAAVGLQRSAALLAAFEACALVLPFRGGRRKTIPDAA